MFAEDEARLLLDATDDAETLGGLVRRRVAGEPLEQVLGWVEVAGVRVAVRPGVFVPRRRSSLLVGTALEVLGGLPDGPPPVVVDVCCGSGALGLAVATLHDRAITLHAADVDPTAVDCAAENLRGLGTVHRGDLLDALPSHLRGRVDVLLVNAPYVPTDRIPLMPAEARDHEPRHTLDGGADGGAVHRRVGAAAASWVRAGGAVVVETSAAQRELTSAAFDPEHWTVRTRQDDDLGATCVQATRR